MNPTKPAQNKLYINPVKKRNEMTETITKRVRCPRVKNSIYEVYVSEKHRKIGDKLDVINTLINDGYITGVSSGSDLLNTWFNEKFNEMIEMVLAKKVNAPVGETKEALTVPQLHIDKDTLKMLLVSKYVVTTPLPRIDEYYHVKIGGKLTTQAVKAGEISKETAADILVGSTEQYFDLVCNTELRNIVKSKNDTRNPIKMKRLHDKLVTEFTKYEKPLVNSPPTPQMITVNGKEIEYNPDEWEELPEPETLTTKPIFS
jgi:hypothetical protein